MSFSVLVLKFANMAEKEIGKVTHYFDHAMVAVVKLTDNLKIGDTVKFSHHDHDFTETVESMEWEHQKVQSGQKGHEVAIKVNQPTHEHAMVYKVEE